jgi:sigma54-dependent transcription regulator
MVFATRIAKSQQWPLRRCFSRVRTSQSQAGEQIEQILGVAYEKVPFWVLGPTAAIVLTDQRVFEIRFSS